MNPTLKSGFSAGGVLARTLTSTHEPESMIPDSILDPNERWMTCALIEAMNGIGWASPNPSVGCVLVHGDRIIARGFTQHYGGKHAERMAFESWQSDPQISSLKGL